MPSLAKGKKAYQANGLGPGVTTGAQDGGSAQGVSLLVPEDWPRDLLEILEILLQVEHW